MAQPNQGADVTGGATSDAPLQSDTHRYRSTRSICACAAKGRASMANDDERAT